MICLLYLGGFMKDMTHHLRHIQKKVIQNNRKQVQQESKANSKVNGNINNSTETMSMEQNQLKSARKIE